MILPDIERHIRRIEFVESIDEWLVAALEIRTKLLGLICKVGQASLRKDEEITLEKHNTRDEKMEFIERVHSLSEGMLGTRDLNEANGIFTGLETKPDSFPNAMRRQDALSHLLRRGVEYIPDIIENSR